MPEPADSGGAGCPDCTCVAGERKRARICVACALLPGLLREAVVSDALGIVAPS